MTELTNKPAAGESDENTKFTTTVPSEIFHHLRLLASHSDPITIFSNHGKSFVVTRLIAVDAKTASMYLEQGGNYEANRQLLSSERNVFSCSPGGIKTQFPLEAVTEVEIDGMPVFCAPLPKEITKLQRREYFRIQTPAATGITCTLHEYQGGGGITLPVYDISLGGISLVLNARIPGFEIGTVYKRAELDLREHGVLPMELKIRNHLVMRTATGGEQRRVGAEFLELEVRAQTLVQRYIAQLERERRALQKDD